MNEIKTLRDYREEEASLRKIEVFVPGTSKKDREGKEWYVGYARFAGNRVEAWSLTHKRYEAALFGERQVRILRAALKEHDDYNVRTVSE